jgi:hypothetical protein
MADQNHRFAFLSSADSGLFLCHRPGNVLFVRLKTYSNVPPSLAAPRSCQHEHHRHQSGKLADDHCNSSPLRMAPATYVQSFHSQRQIGFSRSSGDCSCGFPNMRTGHPLSSNAIKSLKSRAFVVTSAPRRLGSERHSRFAPPHSA